MSSARRKRVAIVQSSYIPWKGYFDLIRAVDEFVLYDDMQFTKRDWRNRNLIKTPQGLQWLTIPVQVKGRYLQKICETKVTDGSWARSHWTAIHQNYRRAPFFEQYASRIETLYADLECEPLLSEINRRFISEFCTLLGISTPLCNSMDHTLVDGKTERLIGLCVSLQATEYLSGPAARSYIDQTQFERAGVNLSFADYSGYPEYCQLYGDFEHGVSVLDLLFNTGTNASRYLKEL